MTSPDVHPRQCLATTDHAAHFWETPSLGWRYCRGVGYSASPVPARAVDREGLIRLIADASNHNPFPEAEDIADTLIDAGLVRVVDTAHDDGEHR